MSKEKPTKTKRRWTKRLLFACLFIVLCLIAGELFARFYVGLGDPPLSIADPKIEYMFKPSSSYWRFGNYVHYNAYSMRSENFPKHKSKPNERRVMLIGDSIINGGNLTDQSELATKRLEKQLSHDLHCPVTVGNISAGSWGPPNEDAYVKRFGFFDADVVVIVLNSLDASDVPTFKPLVGVNPNFPAHKPYSALWEGITRYLPRYLNLSRFGEQAHPAPEPGIDPKNVKESMHALRDLIARARKSGAKVFVAQYLTREEMKGKKLPGYAIIHKTIDKTKATRLTLGPTFIANVKHGGHPYRGPIHPNALGQKLIAKALLKPIERALKNLPAQNTHPTTAASTQPHQ